MGAVDYWCNAFEPAYRALWDAAIGEQDLAVRVRRDPEDSFAEPAAFLARMDELGFDTVLLPSAEVPRDAGPFAYERYATPPQRSCARAAPGPLRGPVDNRSLSGRGRAACGRGARAAAHGRAPAAHAQLDRAFDHRDLYPFYAPPPSTTPVDAGGRVGRAAAERVRAPGRHRPARDLLRRGALRALAHGLAVDRRGDRDGPQTRERVPRHGRVAAAPLAHGADRLHRRSGAGQGAARHRLPGDRPPPGVAMLQAPLPTRARAALRAARRVFTRIPQEGRHGRGTDGLRFETSPGRPGQRSTRAPGCATCACARASGRGAGRSCAASAASS